VGALTSTDSGATRRTRVRTPVRAQLLCCPVHKNSVLSRPAYKGTRLTVNLRPRPPSLSNCSPSASSACKTHLQCARVGRSRDMRHQCLGAVSVAEFIKRFLDHEDIYIDYHRSRNNTHALLAEFAKAHSESKLKEEDPDHWTTHVVSPLSL
jgi:hypothetical protein